MTAGMDILDDIQRRLHDRMAALPGDVRLRIEPELHAAIAAVRRAWGGDRPYIAHTQRQQRDIAVLREHLAGDDVDSIARRHAIHPRTVRRIIARARQ